LGDLAHLMIESLPRAGQQTWSLTHGAEVVIDKDDPLPYARFTSRTSREEHVGATARSTYQIEGTTGSLVRIKKRFDFRTAELVAGKPRYEITGEGTLTFNTAIGAACELDYTQRASVRSGTTTRETPVKVSVHMLDETELAKMDADAKKRREEAQKKLAAEGFDTKDPEKFRAAVEDKLAASRKRFDEMRAAREKPPSAAELDKLVADLEARDDFRTMSALQQLGQKKPEAPNPKVAKALEALLLKSDNVSWRISAAQALENWATGESVPALEQAVNDSNRIVQTYAQKALSAARLRK